MDEVKRELVRAWLIKARNDSTAARQIAASPDGPLDAAIYHCQQSSEKAVKGFLAFHDHRLERSHDVERLVELAAVYEARFKDYEDAAIILTPYATAYRYPENQPHSNRAERNLVRRLASLAIFSRLCVRFYPQKFYRPSDSDDLSRFAARRENLRDIKTRRD
ncbi:MAG TPA: HEPN domain-containing protein [Verrucomicrobiae bacterium]|jgi:HEPN domain-containing protein